MNDVEAAVAEVDLVTLLDVPHPGDGLLAERVGGHAWRERGDEVRLGHRIPRRFERVDDVVAPGLTGHQRRDGRSQQQWCLVGMHTDVCELMMASDVVVVAV